MFKITKKSCLKRGIFSIIFNGKGKPDSNHENHRTGPVSIKNMQTPLLPSKVVKTLKTLWKMWNVLNRVGKLIKKILRFLFFDLSRNFIENWGDDVTKWQKNDQNSKNKNRKNVKFGFSLYSADSGSSM